MPLDWRSLSNVILFSFLAAALAGAGALSSVRHHEMPLRWIGWANALAAGLMLGVAYVLGEVGLSDRVVATALGSLVGIAFVYATHVIGGFGDTPRPRVQALHSASEGVAIGAAMAVSLGLGIFTVIALAAHNIAEGAVLCAGLTRGKFRLPHAAGVAAATNVGQVVMAAVTFILVSFFPSLLPWSLGFAAGALLYLVMVELLPDSYHEAGETSIALVTSVSMGLVVLLNNSFR
ncbi:MAG: ZIP family metal transporter [Gemmatimonadales bacterium]